MHMEWDDTWKDNGWTSDRFHRIQNYGKFEVDEHPRSMISVEKWHF